MTFETDSQPLQPPQPSETSSPVRGKVALTAYPTKSSIAGKRLVKDNKAEGTDQLMGYLD